MRISVKLILSLILGSIFSLFFSPYDLFFLGFLILPIFLWLLYFSSYRVAFLCSLLFSYSFYFIDLFWIKNSVVFAPISHKVLISSVIVFIFPLVLSLYQSIFFILAKYLAKFCSFPLIFSILWIASEMLRSYYLDFPWLLSGYSFGLSIYMMQISAYIGIFGLGFLAILQGSMLFNLRYANYKNIRLIFVPTLFLLLLVFFIGYGRYISSIKRINLTNNVDILSLQPNVDQDKKFDNRYITQNLEKNITMAKRAISTNTQLIVFPETFVVSPITNDTDLSYLQSNFPYNTALLFGAIYIEKDKYYNSIIYLQEKDRKKFFKKNLVPFGEYTPFNQYLPLSFQRLGFSKSNNLRQIVGNNFTIIPIICYEIAYAHLRAKGDFMVEITNDAWFGDSWGLKQHLIMAQFRAIESNKYIIISANSGISAVINNRGEIIKKLQINNRGTINATIEKINRVTIYQRYGNKIIIIIMLILLIINCLIKFFIIRKSYKTC